MAPIETMQVKKLSENAVMPVRGSEHAAGFDLARCVVCISEGPVWFIEDRGVSRVVQIQIQKCVLAGLRVNPPIRQQFLSPRPFLAMYSLRRYY